MSEGQREREREGYFGGEKKERFQVGGVCEFIASHKRFYIYIQKFYERKQVDGGKWMTASGSTHGAGQTPPGIVNIDPRIVVSHKEVESNLNLP